MLAGLRPHEEGPVTIVFGTFGWRHTIVRWAGHARRVGCSHYRIVCMDDRILEFLRERGEAHRAVAFHDLVPDAPRVDFDAMDRRTRLQALTPLRVKAFVRLAATGCDFIHSDADAFWLRDPRPWLTDQPDYDLLCSQGTTFPCVHWHRHRFVLCAGFFFCRANERTRTYFERVQDLAERHRDDQVAMNTDLLADPAGSWHLARPVLAIKWKSAWIRLPLDIFFLRCALYVLRHRALTNLTLPLRWILTSPWIIERRFADGLRVGIIPMHIVMRGRFPGWGKPLVFHSSENKIAFPPPTQGGGGGMARLISSATFPSSFPAPPLLRRRLLVGCQRSNREQDAQDFLWSARRDHEPWPIPREAKPRSRRQKGAQMIHGLFRRPYPGIAERRRTV